MAKKELSVTEKLKSLYSLQKIDNQLKEINILRGELPAEVKDLEDYIAELEARAAKTESAIEEIDKENSKYSASIIESRTLIEKYNAQLDKVKNNREYEALSKEIEMQHLEIQLYEKKQKSLEKSKEVKTQALELTLSRIEDRKNILEEKKKELESIIASTELEEEKLLKKQKTARNKIKDSILGAYDKIQATYKNGLAVVHITRDACGGCFHLIPPQTQLEIQLRKEVISCEHCGRIIVDNETAGIKTPISV